jgi:GT2 family glycosyltransferase
MSNHFECSVIILNLDKADYSERALSSVLTRTNKLNLEIIAINNGSTDNTQEILENFQAKFRTKGHSFSIIKNKSNLGAVTGRNQGLEKATKPYICFIDNDIEIPGTPDGADWLFRLISALKETKASIVAPKMIYPAPINLIQCAGCGVSKRGTVQFRGRKEPINKPEFNIRRECQALISATMVFSRDLYTEIGSLDEIFNPVEFEEIDFCYRARSKGHHCWYIPEVEILHHENITTEGHQTL